MFVGSIRYLFRPAAAAVCLLLSGPLSGAVPVASGPVYHVDPARGNDTFAGSRDRPWKTVAPLWERGASQKGRSSGRSGKARSATEGTAATTVYLHEGRHPAVYLDKSVALTGPVAFVSAPGERAVVTAGRESSEAIFVESKSDLEFRDLAIVGASRLEGKGADVRDSRNILFAHCEIRAFAEGMQIRGSGDVRVIGCHIHELNGTGIKYLPGNTNCLFEANHIHDSETLNGIHAWGISLRSGDVVIRGNIFHDGFNSSCLMTYDDDVGNVYSFSNVTIENNLIFDIVNVYLIRFYKLAGNIVVRNNTLIGQSRGKQDGRYALSTALVVHSYAPGGSGAELTVANNIMLGIADLPAEANVYNNVFWSCGSGGEWSCEGPGGSHVYTCSYGSKPLDEAGALFMETPDFQQGHGRMQDFRLAPGSMAIDFGDPRRQPGSSLGALHADGFIRDSGPLRNDTHHSAGAYEVGAAEIGLSALRERRSRCAPEPHGTFMCSTPKPALRPPLFPGAAIIHLPGTDNACPRDVRGRRIGAGALPRSRRR